MQSLGSSLISAYVNKGEKFSTLTMTQGEETSNFKLPIPPKVERYAFI